jgi:hypothetical protein
MDDIKTNLEALTQHLGLFDKGKQPEYHSEVPHSSHYESTHNSHSPWGSPNSWNKLPKVEMHKFDGSDPAGWVSQLEHYFSLHNIQDDETKLHVGILYLDQERWQWWQWHKKCYPGHPTWNMFTKVVCACFDRESHYLGCLTKLKQTGSVIDFIATFEQLAIRTEGLSDEFYLECFISGLKEAIHAHVCMHHPITWLQACTLALEVETILQAQPLHSSVPNHPRPGATTAPTQTLKVQKVSPTEMEERRKQGLCYYCDDKYAPGHKCHEQKFFQIDGSEDRMSDEAPEPEDTEPTLPLSEHIAPPVEPEEPVISLHALAGISAPQTLKIKGYIKQWSVVVLIDSGNTHNFIHRRVVEDVNCFIRPVSNFQILIANGGTMKCGGRCENVKLQMGDYTLKTHMFSIAMGGCDIVLGVEWLRTLGPITMDYQELYMQFTQEAHTYTLCGLHVGSPKLSSLTEWRNS